MNGQGQFGFNPMFGSGWQMPPGYPWNPMNPFGQGQVQQQVQQNGVQPQVQRQAPMAQQGKDFDFIRVNSYDDIKTFYVPAYGHAWFMFQEDPIIAYKFANEMGVPETKYFKFYEFDPKQEMQQSSENASTQFASAEYVKSLEDQIVAIRGEIDNIKAMGVNANAESIEPVHAPEANGTGTVTAVQRRRGADK